MKNYQAQTTQNLALTKISQENEQTPVRCEQPVRTRVLVCVS